MSYYLPRNFAAKWQNARSICQNYGMEILTLETKSEANYVLEICKSHGQLFATSTHIGGIAAGAKSQDKWFWVTTGEKINYNIKWLDGEPNNLHNGEGMCLSIMKKPDGFYFNDVRCNFEEQRFICEQKT